MSEGDVVPALIWSRMDSARRGRQPALTHTQIARVGVDIAQAESLSAVTMRRVATELGVGTMSLYRYVDTRDEVVDLMVDEVIGQLSVPAVPPGDWRAALAEMARASRAMVHTHPWMASHGLGSRPSFGPRMLRWIEDSTALLDQPGLTIDQILDLSGTVLGFVIGFTQTELAERDAERRTGLTEQQRRASVGPYMLGVLSTGEFPNLERIVRDAEDFPDRGEVFERRLGYVIAGLAVGLGLE